MGGHGGLNILPQKSWNVYNVKNQNIVRRDEAKFKEEQKLAERGAARESQDARLSLLRDQHNPERESRFNLFEDEEKNASEFEKKRQKAAAEKKESDKDTWYLGNFDRSIPGMNAQLNLKMEPKFAEKGAEIDPMEMVAKLLSKSTPLKSESSRNNAKSKPHKQRSVKKHENEKERRHSKDKSLAENSSKAGTKSASHKSSSDHHRVSRKRKHDDSREHRSSKRHDVEQHVPQESALQYHADNCQDRYFPAVKNARW